MLKWWSLRPTPDWDARHTIRTHPDRWHNRPTGKGGEGEWKQGYGEKGQAVEAGKQGGIQKSLKAVQYWPIYSVQVAARMRRDYTATRPLANLLPLGEQSHGCSLAASSTSMGCNYREAKQVQFRPHRQEPASWWQGMFGDSWKVSEWILMRVDLITSIEIVLSTLPAFSMSEFRFAIKCRSTGFGGNILYNYTCFSTNNYQPLPPNPFPNTLLYKPFHRSSQVLARSTKTILDHKTRRSGRTQFPLLINCVRNQRRPSCTTYSTRLF